MSALIPLAVAVPLLGAALTTAAGVVLRGPVLVGLGLAVAAATTGITAFLLVDAAGAPAPLVYWFSGLKPRGSIPLGVQFTVGPLAAATAAFAAALVTLALVASWRYAAAGGAAFPALLLAFQAAMVGFAYSADLFNIFVFFELMTAAGIALSAFRVQARGPLGGGLSMAISNSVGAFLILTGIAVLYARAGALNLQQIGENLARSPLDGPVIVSFGLIVSGFLVKAAAVPFHFWLADTYSTAPAPVCLLFSAIMSELGLYAVARIYWMAFSPALGASTEGVRAVLVAVGAATAVVGAVMCLFQSHLKRMLAFVTTSTIGLFLVGVGLLSREGLGGAAVYVLADGLLKASLFVTIGALHDRLGSVDQTRLHARARNLRVAAALFVAGGLGAAALPPFGPFVGKAMIEEAGGAAGYGWLPGLYVLAEGLTGGAVLAAAARVFLGWGRPWPAEGGKEEADESGEEPAGGRSPALELVPGVVLMVVALAVGFVPQLTRAATEAAGTLQATAFPSALQTPDAPGGPPAPIGAVGLSARSYVYGGLSTLGALLVAWVAPRAPSTRRRWAWPLAALRGLHSGHDGEYVAWITLGATVVTGALAVALR